MDGKKPVDVKVSQDTKLKRGKKSEMTTKRNSRLSSDARKRNTGKVQKPPQNVKSPIEQGDVIVLKVGEETISVEKEMLIASSGYFKALFSGHFVDSDATEIDLTKDVENIEDLKVTLEFLSNNEEKVTEQNAWQLLRVSSFFLMETVIEKCAKFMFETASVANCLQNFLAASTYALPKQYTRKFESILETRFHDFIIYKEDTVTGLGDDDLRYLVRKGIMKYCSKESLFHFLLSWLSKSPQITDKQFTLVSDIIQYFEHCQTAQNVPFQCDKKKTMASISRLMGNIRTSCDPGLPQKLYELFTNFIRNKLPSVQNFDPRTCESCVGVFTFSTRTRINRESTHGEINQNYRLNLPTQSSNEDHFDLNETYDLCVYQPDTRGWFHIAAFGEDTYFSQVDGDYCRPNVEMHQRYPTTIFSTIVAAGDDVMFFDIRNKYKIVCYNFKSRQWINFDIRDKVESNITNYRFERGKNGILYLITQNETYTYAVEFHGYIFDLATFELQPIFSPVIATIRQGNTFDKWSQMTIKLSSVSNELIILCTTGVGNNIVILADIDPLERYDLGATHMLMNRESRDVTKREFLFEDVDILETDDKFLVVSSATDDITVKFQYKFKSKQFEIVEDGANFQMTSKFEKHCKNGNRSNVKDSYWIIDEEHEFASNNKKVRFGSVGNPDIEFHTPPPFVDVISVFATEVRRNFFLNFEPIRNFLQVPGNRTQKSTDD